MPGQLCSAVDTDKLGFRIDGSAANSSNTAPMGGLLPPAKRTTQFWESSDLNGFLPTRGSITLDLVFAAMFLIVIALLFSIWQVRRGRFHLHKRMQIGIALVLLVAVALFEIDMRFFTDWQVLAEPSPLFGSGLVSWMLTIHLIFAVPTPFLWAAVIWLALTRFDNPPRPGAHSDLHKKLAWVATALMILTAVTGWIFYTMAFVIS